MEMKPEEQAEIIIWDWLKTKSSDVKEIYFNRTNKLGWRVFTTKGINKKPDFIIALERFGKIQYIALEIKCASESRNIHDAGKILDVYYINYITSQTLYFIDNHQIKIDHFAVASNNSIKGYLFSDETEIISNTNSEDIWRKTNAKYKLEPSKEYAHTSRYVRELWARFRRIREKFGGNIPSVGILMADFANEDYSPHFMTMVYVDWISGMKSKWGARWWKI